MAQTSTCPVPWQGCGRSLLRPAKLRIFTAPRLRWSLWLIARINGETNTRGQEGHLMLLDATWCHLIGAALPILQLNSNESNEEKISRFCPPLVGKIANWMQACACHVRRFGSAFTCNFIGLRCSSETRCPQDVPLLFPWSRMLRNLCNLCNLCIYVLYCTVLYCTALCCSVLYCAVVYCIVLYKVSYLLPSKLKYYAKKIRLKSFEAAPESHLCALGVLRCNA